MKILLFAASFRRESYNRKLAEQVALLLRQIPEVVLDHADFREFEMPLYDGDIEESSGIPPGGNEFIKRIQANDCMIISTPEYNGGIAGTLKNAIDWASRTSPMPFDGKPLLLIGASPGGFGAIRGLWHTRVPLEAIGTLVYPEMFGLSRAHQAFDEMGGFKDTKTVPRLKELLDDYLKFAKRLTT